MSALNPLRFEATPLRESEMLASSAGPCSQVILLPGRAQVYMRRPDGEEFVVREFLTNQYRCKITTRGENAARNQPTNQR